MKPAPINAKERNLHHVFAAAMLRANTLGLDQRQKAVDAINSVSTPKIVRKTLLNGAESDLPPDIRAICGRYRPRAKARPLGVDPEV